MRRVLRLLSIAVLAAPSSNYGQQPGREVRFSETDYCAFVCGSCRTVHIDRVDLPQDPICDNGHTTERRELCECATCGFSLIYRIRPPSLSDISCHGRSQEHEPALHTPPPDFLVARDRQGGLWVHDFESWP